MKKFFLTLSVLLLFLGCIFIYQNITYNDKKMHVVICDVGQGDAIFIRSPQGSDILIDGGPDDSVLNCLGKHMPFWDKTIELVMLSHPHADHFTGLFSVLKNYKIKSFATENLINKTVGFNNLMDKIKTEKIPTRFIAVGDRFVLKDAVVLKIVGPTQEFLEQTSPGGTIGETGELASLENLLIYKNFTVLLTGDSQALELQKALEFINANVSVLQAPHHGSKSGLDLEILDVLNPQLAVISVGKNNKYGHPNPFTLEILRNKEIKILRTDEKGDIEIISDGLDWKIN